MATERRPIVRALHTGLQTVHPAAWCAALYLALSLVTHIHLTGDAPEYAGEIYDRLRTGVPPAGFWDAGHLVWRPLGFALVYPVTRVGQAADTVTLSAISHTLIVISWVAGLACALILPTWLLRLGASPQASIFATATLLSANAFLNYTHGGSSYVPALACLLAGLYLLSRYRSVPGFSLLGGLSLAGAVLLWFPFILALPGALLAPWVLGMRSRDSARSVAYATAACAVAGFGTYAAVAVHLNVISPTGFLEWFKRSSHGITGNRGVSRAAFGLSRSFLNMGSDGAVLKRFLLHDPYNPVASADLVSLGWKFAFFYAVLVAIAVTLWRSSRRWRLVFCLISAVPVVLFGISWQGGDSERYFPLYPALLLALATSISTGRATSVGRLLPESLAVLSLLVNVPAYSRHMFAAEENAIVSRVGAFDDSLLPPGSILVLPTFNDRLGVYFRSGTVDRQRIRGTYGFHGLVEKGSDNMPQWREGFSTRALAVWDAGGRIWLSRRVLSPIPEKNWDWVEGDDRRVSWSDLPTFFTPFDLGATRGGVDGFVELLPTPRNRSRLRATLASD